MRGKGERKKGKSTRKENVGFGGEGGGNFGISESKKIWGLKSKMGDIDSITLKIGGRILRQTSLFFLLLLIIIIIIIYATIKKFCGNFLNFHN